MAAPYSAEISSKTKRKEARREVRNWLGAGREDAPNLTTVLRAAYWFDKLLRYASNGRMAIYIHASRDGHEDYWTPAEARVIAEEAGVERDW